VKCWNVITLPNAENNIEDIYKYITFELLEPIIAANLIKRIKTAINGLNQMPERFRLYDKEPWRSKELRLFSIGNYIIFYHVDMKSDNVYVDAVIYGARDLHVVLEDEVDL
jgi:toxin ParE1/3/4